MVETDIIETEVMGLMPATDKEWWEDFQDIKKLWDIDIIFVGTGPDGYQVKYRGHRSVVRLFLIEHYGSNEVIGTPEMENYLNGLMGDKLAMHRWETGCQVQYKRTDEFNWDHHWEVAGAHRANSRGAYDVAHDAAVNALVEAGFKNPDNERIQRAQSYLMLAALTLGDTKVIEAMDLSADTRGGNDGAFPFEDEPAKDPERLVVVDDNAYTVGFYDEGVPYVAHAPVNADGTLGEFNESEVMPATDHTTIGSLMSVLFNMLDHHHQVNC